MVLRAEQLPIGRVVVLARWGLQRGHVRQWRNVVADQRDDLREVESERLRDVRHRTTASALPASGRLNRRGGPDAQELGWIHAESIG